MNENEIATLISNSFSTLPFPNVYGKGAEGDIVDIYYTGRSWRCVTWDYLSKCELGDSRSHFYFMTHEARFYYLPAYLLMALKNGLHDLDIMYNGLLHELTAIHELPKSHEDKRRVNYNNEQFYGLASRMSELQKNIIAAFLKHQITHLGPDPIDYINEDAKAAYDSYWYQFDPERTAGT